MPTSLQHLTNSQDGTDGSGGEPSGGSGCMTRGGGGAVAVSLAMGQRNSKALALSHHSHSIHVITCMLAAVGWMTLT